MKEHVDQQESDKKTNTEAMRNGEEMPRPAPSAPDSWTCTCGKTGITSRFCPYCGSKRPKTAAEKQKRSTILGIIAGEIIVAIFLVVTQVFIPGNNYRNAVALQQSGKYEEAISAFEALENYRDSKAKIAECQTAILEKDYQTAIALQQSGKYEEAISAFEALGSYSDSAAQITATRYLQAKALTAKGDYVSAVVIFSSIKDYKDVDSLLTNDPELSTVMIAAAHEVKIASLEKAGSYVTFGHYPQTEAGNDSTEIEWLVLDYDAKNNRALLLSRYGLDAQPYHTEYVEEITWEKCTLRAWLNGEFMNKAFSTAEQSAILLTNVDNSSSQNYSGWSTDGGNDTQDKVFLLSYAEANQYLNVQLYGVDGADNNIKSRVSPTAYALQQDEYTSSSNMTADGTAAGAWWLRSPGYFQFLSALVGYDGSFGGNGLIITCDCVRPAIWVDLDVGCCKQI